jgi:hypothetical protein
VKRRLQTVAGLFAVLAIVWASAGLITVIYQLLTIGVPVAAPQ